MCIWNHMQYRVSVRSKCTVVHPEVVDHGRFKENKDTITTENHASDKPVENLDWCYIDNQIKHVRHYHTNFNPKTETISDQVIG